MGILTFLFLVTILFSGAAAWAFWEWRSGRTDERPMWLKAFHICALIALMVAASYAMAVMAKYHVVF